MKPITIVVTARPAHVEGYEARLKGDTYTYLGASPDEAVGQLIREQLLSADGPIAIKEIRHDEPAPAGV